MHIEPGVVDGAKIVLSYGTAAASIGLAGKMVHDTFRDGASATSLLARSLIATAAVLTFFQLLPHQAVGVSEVHLILGSTLFLMLGAGPAAVGLSSGLLLQGLLFAPLDLPQYGMNLTTLLVPLAAVSVLAQRIIPSGTRYADLGYVQTFALSSAFQLGIVGWVAFWAFYGKGFGAENIIAVGSFGAAYMLVVLIEPLVDLAVLAMAKSVAQMDTPLLMQRRVLATA